MRRYRHTYDPDVDNAEYAEIYDAYYDTRPTRADVDDRPETVVATVAIELCDDCEHLTCVLQRRVGRSAWPLHERR